MCHMTLILLFFVLKYYSLNLVNSNIDFKEVSPHLNFKQMILKNNLMIRPNSKIWFDFNVKVVVYIVDAYDSQKFTLCTALPHRHNIFWKYGDIIFLENGSDRMKPHVSMSDTDTGTCRTHEHAFNLKCWYH